MIATRLDYDLLDDQIDELYGQIDELEELLDHIISSPLYTNLQKLEAIRSTHIAIDGIRLMIARDEAELNRLAMAILELQELWLFFGCDQPGC